MPLRLRPSLARLLFAVVLLAVSTAWGGEAAAQEPRRIPDKLSGRAGFETVSPSGGPDSVQSALRAHDRAKESYFRLHWLQDRLKGYYRFKERLARCHDLAIGLDYNMLYQYARPNGMSTDAAGGVFRFYGVWGVVNPKGPDRGRVVFRLENRHAYGLQVAPEDFHLEIGSLLKTANSFADWGWGVTNLQWQQGWRDERYSVAVGQVDLRDWVDTFTLSNWRTALLSAAVTYPTNPLPSAGLGAAAKAYYRDRNTPYVMAGFSDANGHPTRFGIDTLFEQRELYSFVEAGWTKDRRKKDENHARLVFWHQDARKQADKPEGWGLSFSTEKRVSKRIGVFLRGGWAEGGLIPTRAGLVAGVGWHRRSHDLLGTAIGWADPEDDSLREQVTIETFWRIQVSENWGLTPDVELIFDPSNNPTESFIAVLSLRMQLAF